MQNKMDKIFITGPVGQLETLVSIPVNTPITGIAVLIHPNPTQGGSNTNKVIQTMAKVLKQRGHICFLPNLRGTGLSEGTHDKGMGETDDVMAVIDYAKAYCKDLTENASNHILLGGFSFGAYVSTFVLHRRDDVKQTLLVGPAVGKYTIAAPSLPNPDSTLIVHGQNDEVIPLNDVFIWAEPQNMPVVVLPGSTHFFHGKLIQLAQILHRFL